MMDEMTPESFGYNKIHPDKIGSSRAERRIEIATLEAQLLALVQERDDLQSKLTALGYAVPVSKGN